MIKYSLQGHLAVLKSQRGYNGYFIGQIFRSISYEDIWHSESSKYYLEFFFIVHHLLAIANALILTDIVKDKYYV